MAPTAFGNDLILQGQGRNGYLNATNCAIIQGYTGATRNTAIAQSKTRGCVQIDREVFRSNVCGLNSQADYMLINICRQEVARHDGSITYSPCDGHKHIVLLQL